MRVFLSGHRLLPFRKSKITDWVKQRNIFDIFP